MIIREKSTPVKFKKIGKLPSKPSELIKIAIKDLISAEKMHKINMSSWFDINPKTRECTVCLAGAIMACTLKNTNKMTKLVKERIPTNAPSYTVLSISPYQLEESFALEAVDSFRQGDLQAGFASLDLALPSHFVTDVEITQYSKNKSLFKKQMLALAKALAKEGY